MDSLIYSLNATLPVFLVMVFGYILKRIGMINEEFIKVANKLNFKVTLPAMLFLDLCTINLKDSFEPKFVIFVAAITLIMIFGIWIFAKLFVKDKNIVGEFVQASYRSSVAVFGIAFMTNIYGNAGEIPMIIIGSVPIFNILAVLILAMESPQNKAKNIKSQLKTALINIFKNPIIIGIFLGIFASLINLRLPQIASKALISVASLTTPLALLCIGASFEGKKAFAKIKPTIAASVFKLVIIPAIFLPIAVKMGFRDGALTGIIIFLGSTTTPSAYIMSKSMGHEGVLTSSTVMVTTLFSSITLTFWIFCARYFCLI